MAIITHIAVLVLLGAAATQTAKIYNKECQPSTLMLTLLLLSFCAIGYLIGI